MLDKDGFIGMWGLFKIGIEVFLKGFFVRFLLFFDGMCKVWMIFY